MNLSITNEIQLSVRELHDKAMELADYSFIAKHKGKEEDAIRYANEACIYETMAANKIERLESSEPTRSILYRSAACLAYNAKDYKMATDLAREGLKGYPLPEIREELLDVLWQAGMQNILIIRHDAWERLAKL
jgi:hypothetical protein